MLCVNFGLLKCLFIKFVAAELLVKDEHDDVHGEECRVPDADQVVVAVRVHRFARLE